ncbi:MAG: response regulator, partial [Elusimicrobiales bacterium]
MIKINLLFAAKDFIKTSLLIEMIKRNEYNLVTSTKSTEVFALLEARKIDLLIIAQELQDVSGLVLLKNIRSSKFKEIPVVAIV